jgi:PEGA domain
MKHAFYWTALLCAAALGGCASTDKTILSDPPNASVTVDGDLVGTTPAKYNFDFNRHTQFDVSVSKDGYISSGTTVYSDTVQANESELHFSLEKDPS